MKAFLDTNVYISHYRAGLYREWLHRINSEYSFYLHAVVLAELYAGAKSRAFKKELSRLEKMFEARGKIIVPQKRDYCLAGIILQKLRERHLLPEGKVSLWLADALLAASARHEGMVLISEDNDFEKIKKVQTFSLKILTLDA